MSTQTVPLRTPQPPPKQQFFFRFSHIPRGMDRVTIAEILAPDEETAYRRLVELVDGYPFKNLVRYGKVDVVPEIDGQSVSRLSRARGGVASDV